MLFSIFTGDNLDIYVKTSHLSRHRRNKDLHLFTSNVIFSRISKMDMSNEAPKTDISKLFVENMLLGKDEFLREKLK